MDRMVGVLNASGGTVRRIRGPRKAGSPQTMLDLESWGSSQRIERRWSFRINEDAPGSRRSQEAFTELR